MKLRVLAVGLALIASACAGASTAPSGPTVALVPADTAPAVASSTTDGTASGSSTSAGAPAATTVATSVPQVALDEIRLDVELVADGFEQPILALARTGDHRLFIADQPGIIYALDSGSGEISVVLDITDRVRFSDEQGLLGAAFDPGDPGRMIVHYSALDGSTTVVEFRLGDAGEADPGDGRVILSLPQPAPNHNGGMIEFGPDGFLYVALGDGGGGGDQFDNGQDPFSQLGSILRLDVGGGDPYAIPADNPFADGVQGSPEVWLWGLRNPWRFSFDGSDLWVGDVGQGEWEEVDLFDDSQGGSNAGWPLLEGDHCFRVEPCHFDDLVGPVYEYSHDGRCSIIGGVVYRGTSIPDLVGTYLFGDFCSGEVWGLRNGDPVEVALLTDFGGVFLPPLDWLTSFGVGPEGEVYLLQSGLVWRLVGV